MEQKENKSRDQSQAATEWLLRAGFSPGAPHLLLEGALISPKVLP
jgi:hypothetical protein